MSGSMLSVPRPCHEKWDRFTPTKNGAFCGSCQKEVIDFTNWTDGEIKDYFAKRTGPVCGRLKQSQLTTHVPDKKHQLSKWMTVFTLVLLMVTKSAQGQPKGRIQDTVEVDQRTRKSVNHSTDKHWIVTGTVVDENRVPLPGVNVVQKNSVNGTVTDVEGNFRLMIGQPKVSEVISASFIGFTTTDTLIYQSQHVVIRMKTDVAALHEVVVVGGVCARPNVFRRIWWEIKRVFQR